MPIPKNEGHGPHPPFFFTGDQEKVLLFQYACTRMQVKPKHPYFRKYKLQSQLKIQLSMQNPVMTEDARCNGY